MATIERYKISTGENRYRVRYRTPERRQTDKRGFRTRREAETFAKSVESAIYRGDYVSDTAGSTTVSDMYDEWSASRTRLKASTRAKQDTSWRVHVRPRWGAVPVSGVRTPAVRAWVAEMTSAGTGAATIESALRVLRGVMEYAIEDRRLNRDPTLNVKPPRRGHTDRGYLTHAQVEALAREISTQTITFKTGKAKQVPQPTHGTIVRFLAYTGLRWGEMAALRVKDIQTGRRRIDIRRAVAEVRGEMIYSTPKTHERRSVPYPPFLDEELAALCAGKGRDDIVFAGPKGGVQRVSDFRPRYFLPAVKRCQRADRTFPHVSPHDLRHSAASLAISAGANVKAVQTMLGHKSAAMTLDTYADLFPDDLDSVAQALAAQRGAHANGANEETGDDGTNR